MCYNESMSSVAERARIRRLHWHGQVVQVGDPKGALYDELSPVERWAAFVELNERAWIAAGHSMPAPLPHSQWPGEVFEQHGHDD